MLWATKMSHYVLVLHCLHKECPCTPFFYKLGKTQVPTTKRAESMSPDCLYYKDCSQYCFIVQSLHTTRPTFSWDYKNHSKVIPKILYILTIVSSKRFSPCTKMVSKKHVPLLLCIVKLAQSTPQQRFCITEVAKETSLYYFEIYMFESALQSLHKAAFISLCTTRVA